MADTMNTPPAYEDYLPRATNPYHVGYDQPGNQGFTAGNQKCLSVPQGTIPMQQTVPGAPMQSNSMVVTSQPQPTIVISPKRGNDLTFPAVLACLFCCCFTGIPAIIFAVKAQNEYVEGNLEAAEGSQRIARSMIIISIGIHFLVWIVFAIFYLTVANA